MVWCDALECREKKEKNTGCDGKKAERYMSVCVCVRECV